MGRDVKDLVRMITQDDQNYTQQVLAVTTRQKMHANKKKEALKFTKKMMSNAAPTALAICSISRRIPSLEKVK